MDWLRAIHYAQMVQAAESIEPFAVGGPSVKVLLGEVAVEYDILTTVFANDLATDSDPTRRDLIVSIGYVAQSRQGDVVIAIRGTHGIHEWLHDCKYHAVPCPFLADAGHTEDGFTEIYQSLRAHPDLESPRLRDVLASMTFPYPVTSITLTGHSLGAAVVTLLALDLAANTPYRDLELYTYASPRTGDERFVAAFHQLVPRAYRIANRLDIVTEAPPSLLCHATPYQHVEATTTLVPGTDVGHHIICMHHLTTYLYLMAVQAKVADGVIELLPECCRKNEHHWIRSLERLHEYSTENARELGPA